MSLKDDFGCGGRMDLYADSTPVGGRPISLEHLPPEQDWKTRNSRLNVTDPPRIKFNPSAGEIYTVEKGKPWKKYWEKRVAKDENKAGREMKEKRLWGLSKQVCSGLQHSLGIAYGVAEMKNILELARNQIENNVEVKDEESSVVYGAALKYDLLTIATKLNLKIKASQAPCPGYSKTFAWGDEKKRMEQMAKESIKVCYKGQSIK
jgi:hypothetical protein